MGARTGRAGGAATRKFSAGVRERLIAHAAHERRLAERHKDGHTEREHLEAAARTAPAARIALAGPGIPREAAYLWDWFAELNAARTSNGFGANPIGYAELDAWARLTRRRPSIWEVRWLRLLDRVWTTEPGKSGGS